MRCGLVAAVWLCAVAVLLTGDPVAGRVTLPKGSASFTNYNWAKTTPATARSPTRLSTTQARTTRVSTLPQPQGKPLKQVVFERLLKKFAKEVAKELLDQLFPTDPTSTSSATLLAFRDFPVCTLSILSEFANADVAVCNRQTAYNLRSALMPTPDQKKSLCSGQCLKVLDRLVATPIPYCAINFNGGISDLLGALYETFSECTVIPQSVLAVQALAASPEEGSALGSGSGSRRGNESEAVSEPEDTVPEPEDVSTTPVSTTEAPKKTSAACAEYHAATLATASFIVALVLA